MAGYVSTWRMDSDRSGSGWVRRRSWRRSAIGLLAPAGALLVMGWLALWRAEQLADGAAASSLLAGGGRLMRQQIVWSVAALCVMALGALVDYRRIARLAPLLYLAVVVALVAVYAFPMVNRAHRWIRIAGIGVQPSEFAKVIFIIALASYLAHRNIAANFTAVLAPLAMAGVPMLLILKEPDLGTSLVFLPVLFAMLFAAARGGAIWCGWLSPDCCWRRFYGAR